MTTGELAAREDLIRAVLRRVTNERAEPHAHRDDDLYYDDDMILDAARRFVSASVGDRIAIVKLPAPDVDIDSIDDDGQDALAPGWTDSCAGIWTAWTTGVSDPDGDHHDNIEDVRRDALAALAAVHQVELWRAERDARDYLRTIHVHSVESRGPGETAEQALARLREAAQTCPRCAEGDPG